MDAVQAIVLLAGAGLRLRQFAFRRSLWTDEAMIALNVIHRGYGGLTRPLGLLQDAPILWLWIERACTQVFGPGEYALRLPAVVASLFSLLIFGTLARRLLGPLAATVGMLLFAFSPPLIYFASEVKPYGVDVAVALGLLLLAARSAVPTPRSEAVFAGVVVVSVLLSFPAAFVAGATAAVRALQELRRRDLRTLAVTLAGTLLWAGTFAVEDIRAVRPNADAPAIRAYWAAGYAPRPLRAASTLDWLGPALRAVARYPIESSAPALLLGLVLLGLVALRRQGILSPLLAGVALIVVAAAIAAAYPLADRLVLFAVPLTILAAAAAVDITRSRVGRAGVAGLAIVAFAGVFPHAFDRATSPYTHTEFRQALQYAGAHERPGDLIWLHYATGAQYLYYEPLLHIPAQVLFRISPAACGPPVVPLLSRPPAGTRVWLVFGLPPGNAPPVSSYLSAFRQVAVVDLWHPTSLGSGAALLTITRAIPPVLASPSGCLSLSPIPMFK